ncbi:hypothetical protein LX32DRAFT_657634 [Colletotrichum zoysiae]|uniref:Uncharacterized protein n=1 Tax=Colletotrichum zoysiae TaxID=1216348 RepID=A0AAD9LY33_9PEZI|nr:hypothetical protein LX32DRAFT_657634 [Colletotrichum zoysiae]
MRVFGVVATLLGCARVQAKAVFAHFMISWHRLVEYHNVDMDRPGEEADSVLCYKVKHTTYDVQQVLDRLAATNLVSECYAYVDSDDEDKINTRRGMGYGFNSSSFERRAETEPDVDKPWHRSQVSSYPTEEWFSEGTWFEPAQHEYFHNVTLGAGQYIYVFKDGVSEAFVDGAGDKLELIKQEFVIRRGDLKTKHGDMVGSFVISPSAGILPEATMIVFDNSVKMISGKRREKVLAGLLAMISDIKDDKK